MNIYKSTFFLFLLILCCSTKNSQIFDKVDSIISSSIKKDDPGLGVGIIKNGKVVYEKYRGLSNLQHQIPFSDITRSNIASTAKQFTALMVLDLSLKGKLNIDDDIRVYLPNLYNKVKVGIKIRHLINHTSGVQEYAELFDQKGDIWWKKVGLDNDEILALLEQKNKLEFNPGTKYNYSNSNYIILAKIVEIISKQKFTDYSKLFFTDLGMEETSFVERYMKVIPNRANPYSDWGNGEWWETPTVTKTSGEGFLYTTLKDQLLYEKKLQNSNLELFRLSQQPIPGSEIKTYGFGLKLENRFGSKTIHHDGVTFGFHSQTLRFPEQKLTIFILSNNGNIRSDLMANEIAKLYLIKNR